MSNIAGKAYGMNVITPIRWYMVWANRLIFHIAVRYPSTLKGLITLSLIHYARWTIIPRGKFPHLSPSQPKEDLKYSYMLFHTNFNGSWDQYVDSFTFAIPSGLDLFWKLNVRYPKSVPLTPFHDYIRYNQIDNDHYYSAYPMATSNDVKSAKKVKQTLIAFNSSIENLSADDFQKQYNKMLRELQNDLGDMRPAPVVSMAAKAVSDRAKISEKVADRAMAKKVEKLDGKGTAAA